jgi:hypothetical protein
MVFRLKKETRHLREEVFQLLPHSRQEQRKHLLRVRDILWTIDNALIFGDKNQKELLTLFSEALELVFLTYSDSHNNMDDYEQMEKKF